MGNAEFLVGKYRVARCIIAGAGDVNVVVFKLQTSPRLQGGCRAAINAGDVPKIVANRLGVVLGLISAACASEQGR